MGRDQRTSCTTFPQLFLNYEIFKTYLIYNKHSQTYYQNLREIHTMAPLHQRETGGWPKGLDDPWETL